MKGKALILKNILISVIVPAICFYVCLLLQEKLKTEALIPAIFVLGAFLTSVLTDGYIYGIISALISTVCVNYAFTFPFFSFDFTLTENLVSVTVLLTISLITCSLATKLKKQERIMHQSEMESMRANLLRAVSHDLRTPLTTIYASSSALLEEGDNFTEEQKKKILAGICQDAQWLTGMVENLLSITKINGNVKLVKSPTVLEELIDSVLLKFNKRYPGMSVSIDIPDNFIIIPVDAILIEQVLVNLLENSVQHAEGMTEIILRVFMVANKAIFEVEDNGCGIPEEYMKELFNGYYTRQNSMPDSHSNRAGIGLSVCRTIIRAHGGEIRAENLKKGGCVFQFTLDLEDEENG